MMRPWGLKIEYITYLAMPLYALYNLEDTQRLCVLRKKQLGQFS